MLGTLYKLRNQKKKGKSGSHGELKTYDEWAGKIKEYGRIAQKRKQFKKRSDDGSDNDGSLDDERQDQRVKLKQRKQHEANCKESLASCMALLYGSFDETDRVLFLKSIWLVPFSLDILKGQWQGLGNTQIKATDFALGRLLTDVNLEKITEAGQIARILLLYWTLPQKTETNRELALQIWKKQLQSQAVRVQMRNSLDNLTDTIFEEFAHGFGPYILEQP